MRSLWIALALVSAPPQDRSTDAAVPQIQFCHPVEFPDGAVDLGNPGGDDA